MKKILFPALLCALAFLGMSKSERFIAGKLIEILQSQGFVGIKGKVERNQFLIDAVVNGKSARMVVDTGATSTFFGKNHIHKYGLEILGTGTAKTVLGSASTSKSKMRSFHIGGYKIKNMPVIITDTKQDHPVLGMDFFTTFNAVIFCRYGTVFINPDHPAGWTEKIKRMGFHQAPVKVTTFQKNNLKSKYFHTQLSVNGGSGEVIVDTGAFMTLLDEKFFSRARVITEQIAGASLIDAASNRKDISQIDGHSVFVGPVKMEEKNEFQVAPGIYHHADYAGADVYGNIGIDLLSTNRGIIDVGNNALFFDSRGY